MKTSWLIRVSAAVVLFAGGGLLLTRCGQSKCDSNSCKAGCCDSTGACQSGTTAGACGTGGSACSVCAGTHACTGQSCEGPGPGNDGGNGNDAGNTPDGGAACTNLTTFMATQGGGDYIPDSGGGFSDTQAFLVDATGELLEAEMYYGPNPGEPANSGQLPYSENFDAGTSYLSCNACVTFGTGCTMTGCAHNFLATGGSATVTRADQDPVNGTMIATGTNLHFTEWNFMADTPINGGQCVNLTTASWNVFWGDGGSPADSGTPDSGTPDSGTPDSGTTAVDSGKPDSGAPDSGTPDAGSSYPLTVINAMTWCTITVQGPGGGTFSGGQQIFNVPAGTVGLSLVPLNATFEIGPAPWHDTAGDMGSGDPGTVSGNPPHDSTTVYVDAGATCVWACCPFSPGGGGCTTTQQCP
jgi:hypothetical protein